MDRDRDLICTYYDLLLRKYNAHSLHSLPNDGARDRERGGKDREKGREREGVGGGGDWI